MWLISYRFVCGSLSILHAGLWGTILRNMQALTQIPHLSFRFALPSCWNGKSVAYLLKVLREGEEGFFFSPEQPWIIYYTVENSPGVWSHIVPRSFSNLNAQFLREKENKKAHNSHVPFKHARKHIQMHGHHSYWPQILFNLSDLFGAEST